MVLESKLQQPSQLRRRSVQRKPAEAAPTTAPVTTGNNFFCRNEAPQPRPRLRSMSMQHDPGDPTLAQGGPGLFDSTRSTIAQNALEWLNRTGNPSALDKRRYAHSSMSSMTTSLGSTNPSPTSSGMSSRRPSGGDLSARIVQGTHVATRLAHLQDSRSPVPQAQQAGHAEPQQETQETATNDSRQPPASTSTSGYSVQRLPTLGDRMFEPEAILLTELLTNVTSLVSTLVNNGPVGYVAARAVGPLGLVNSAQLFHSNWANAGETGVSEVSVLASLGSQYAAVMSTWTGWWSSQAADFHSRVGAIAGIASEIADVRDAWADRSENPARSIALAIRILSIWAASISAFLSLSEAEHEGSMAPTYGLSASVLPVVGTFAGMTAEALNRTPVRNRLRALVSRIRSLIRRLMRLLGYGEHSAFLMDPSPV